jgi:hypothetical protein
MFLLAALAEKSADVNPKNSQYGKSENIAASF